MNSGVLGILTHQCPYQFRGLRTISTIFYLLDLILFIIFSIIFILRFIMFESQAYNEIINNQADLMLVACWPIAFMTLTSLTPLILSNTSWGGHPWTIVGYVMWWFVVLANLIILFFVFITLIRHHEASDRRMPMQVILPAVSVSTIAVTGGLITSLSNDMSPRLAIPIIITSFMLVGIGILLGLILSTYLFHNLLAQGWPPPPATPTLFIFVGPMGQSAAALQFLGAAAQTHAKFAPYNKGTFITAESAPPLNVACVLIALMLTGLGIIWTIFAVYAMIERAVQKKLSWTPSWNAIIFPLGTLTTSTSLFGIAMDSPAWRVVTAMLIIVLTGVFFVNLGFTLTKIWRGELLVVRIDPRVKKRFEGEQKGK